MKNVIATGYSANERVIARFGGIGVKAWPLHRNTGAIVNSAYISKLECCTRQTFQMLKAGILCDAKKRNTSRTSGRY